jgi:hypothetical protein
MPNGTNLAKTASALGPSGPGGDREHADGAVTARRHPPNGEVAPVVQRGEPHDVPLRHAEGEERHVVDARGVVAHGCRPEAFLLERRVPVVGLEAEPDLDAGHHVMIPH